MYNKLYTIGYAGYNIDDFISSLLKANVNAVVDVRSSPFSKMFPDFNKDKIYLSLKKNHIYYIPMSTQLGARPDNYEVYTNNQVDFLKMAESSSFLDGCSRIKEGLLNYTVCLMCSERDPVTCHRAILVSHTIKKLYPEINIFHILPNKIEANREMENRLLNITKCDQLSLNGGSIIDEAYLKQGKKIAYRLIENMMED